VRAGALDQATDAGQPRGRPLDWKALAATWASLVAAVLAVAGLIAVVWPDWLPEETRELPDSPMLVIDILTNNLLIALLPLLGGWLAAGYSVVGHRLLAGLFVLAPTLIVARSLVTIGAVGGADPAWLAAAARWWLLEVAALAASSNAGLWLVRNAELRERHGRFVARRAVLLVVSVLTVAAVVEVLTA
jgi:hypothetical protein